MAGFLVGLLLFAAAVVMSTDNVLMFFSVQSLLLVLGGTFANAFISFQARYVLRAFTAIAQMFYGSKYEQDLIVMESKRIIGWAYMARKSGVLSLEKTADGKEAHDHLLKYGIRLVADNKPIDEVRSLLDNVVQSTFNRTLPVVSVLKGMGSSAPAFGMVGTLVGLIVMLDSMSSDPDGLGRGLAIALLTTLYGVLMARLVFQPAADKTLQRAYIEQFRNKLIVRCLCCISAGKSPNDIELELTSMLDPALQVDFAKVKQQRSGAGG
ncbi:MAG: flagellar motor protein MotA [Deltaproteobacteria bacterium]|nr:flagellar motor protein MotA [Deltaproteobacteria bacterium]HCH62608.1 flagellar motor protein MotA [Deltaproteobacteria bacterium]